MDTIFAEASPTGRGGVSIIRISGPMARKVAEGLAGPLPVARRAELRYIRDADEVLDQALVIRFDPGASFSGEEVVELHLHGAPVVVRRVSLALRNAGVRQAEAGEFTRRAFLNGRMDLSEVEGLSDLLEAETETQRRLALQTASGALGRRAEDWRQMLIRAGALTEASVDFADEEVPDDIPPEAIAVLDRLRDELEAEIAGYSAAERIRTGFEVAVIGPPNAGKSSFINRIAKREIALVSGIAGTTRDIIELRVDLRGLSVTFLDTAGLRMSDDLIETMGVDRARKRAEAADLRIHLSETGAAEGDLLRDGDLVVFSKADLGTVAGKAISAETGAGVPELLGEVYDILAERVAGAGLVSHQRQLNALTDAAEALTGAHLLPPELLAESIRAATASLDSLVGKIGAEDYLDEIFSSFCIGK